MSLYRAGMKEGALVLVDCLGFRGIWNRVDAKRLIGRLQSMEKLAAERIIPKYSAANLSYGPLRFHLRLLSDTVALSIQYEANSRDNPEQRQLDLLASIACDSASVLATLFIDSDDMPLPLRGCISFGRHLCEGNFLIGPAVDEAAEYMNEPEGAFIWVLPGAAERTHRFRTRASTLIQGVPKEMVLRGLTIAAERGVNDAKEILKHPDAGTDAYLEALRETFAQILTIPSVIETYPMPIKGGAFLDATVINPLVAAKSDEERKRVIGRYDQFLQGNRIDIWTKRQNTMKFLAIAEQAAANFRTGLGVL